jgi:hypothetical protein
MLTLHQHANRRRKTNVSGPSSITGLILWLDASSESGSDGSTIVANDRSGSGNNAITTGADPTLQTVSGIRVYRFNGTSQYAKFNNSLVSGLTVAEVFVLVKIAVDAPIDANQTGLWEFGGDATRTHFPYIDGVIYDQFGTSARKTTVNPTPSLSGAFRVYNVISAAGEWTSNLDGSQLFTTATNTVAFTTSTPLLGTGNSDGVLGHDGYHLTGDIKQLTLFNRKLTTSERTSVTNYLLARA